MTVKELKKILKECDDDALVVMSSDSEGNSYDTLHDISPQYHYDVAERELVTNEYAEADGEEPVDLSDYPHCIVLWP